MVLKILAVEDDPLQQALVASFIASAGHDALTASTGREALQVFAHNAVDVVLVDYDLPDMTGIALVKQIREHQKNWLPILFLSAHDDVEIQRNCLLSGGDDFITKPFDLSILEAKISARSRTALLHRQIHRQNEQLQRHINEDAAEADAAHYLYSRLTAANASSAEGCANWLWPASKFSGDIISTGVGSNGHHYLLLADATGHGLSAAIGLIPVTQVFHAMSRKGHHISNIVREMNAQVRRFTPIYRFVAACLVEIDPHRKCVHAWNGGMPTGYLFRGKETCLLPISSRHVALGLNADHAFDSDVESFPYETSDVLLLFSDGVTDAEDFHGKRIGYEPFAELLLTRGRDLAMQDIQALLQAHVQKPTPNDDVAVILCHLASANGDQTDSNANPRSRLLADSALSLRLRDQLIGQLDVLPTIVEWCRKAGVSEYQCSRIHTVMAELISNAIDHGILRLDSQLKAGSEGFIRYVEERLYRLSQLQSASLDIDVALQNNSHGAVARITVSDSGTGFDHAAVLAQLQHGATQHGRGLLLVRELSETLAFSGAGNRVEVSLRL